MTNDWGLPRKHHFRTQGPETSGEKYTQLEELGGQEVALGTPRLPMGLEPALPS